MTLFSRGSKGRAEVDRAVTDLEICELPSARGCTYVVPKDDFALALCLGRGTGESPDLKTAKKFLGVTDGEMDRLCGRVLDALTKGYLEPAQIRESVGDVVRNLGDEGKKRGLTTTLSLALGRLQSLGEIRRQSTNGRIDNQRYGYVKWENSPLTGNSMDIAEAMTALAKRYFRWIGPATLANFQWFSGLSGKAAKEAVRPLGLVPFEDGNEYIGFPADHESFCAHRIPSEPQYCLVNSLDAMFLHRRDIFDLLDPNDLNRTMPGEKKIYDQGSVQDLSTNAILDRGRIVGLWEYDSIRLEIAWVSFVPSSESLRKTISKMEDWIRADLGDCRTFSLDSPESRQPKIEAIRQMRG